jgi:integrase
MAANGQGRATGHVRLRRGQNGPVWYARYRLPDGRQRQRRLGFAWEEKPGKAKQGRPPDGWFTRRTAKAELEKVLERANAGKLDGQRPLDPTFADAATEFLRYVEQVRRIDDKTVRDYAGVVSGYLIPEFGEMRLEDIGPDDIDEYKERLLAEGRLTNRTVVRHLTVLHGVFKRAGRVWGLERNPASADLVDRPRVVYSGEFTALTGDQVELLAAHARDAQDAAIYVTAAYTGLRQGELLALRWRDVDLVDALVHVRRNYTDRRLKQYPKGKRVRSVPLASTVVDRLARLKDRGDFTDDDDFVFSVGGAHLDAWALRRRYYRALDAAGLERIRFHDLRHVFGTQARRELDERTLQGFMGHQHASTTARYTHFQPRPADAAAIERAFGGGGDKPGGETGDEPRPDRERNGLVGREPERGEGR